MRYLLLICLLMSCDNDMSSTERHLYEKKGLLESVDEADIKLAEYYCEMQLIKGSQAHFRRIYTKFVKNINDKKDAQYMFKLVTSRCVLNHIHGQIAHKKKLRKKKGK